MKVNPNLVVEVKPNQVPREMRNEIARKLRAQRMHVMPYALYCLNGFFMHPISHLRQLIKRQVTVEL